MFLNNQARAVVEPKVPETILTFRDLYPNTADLTTYTFNNVDFGPEVDGRIVLIAVHASTSVNATIQIQSVDVGDGTPSVVVEQGIGINGRDYAGIVEAKNVSGTSGTVTITFTALQLRCTIASYSLVGASAVQDTAIDTVAQALNVTLDVPANGAVLAVSKAQRTGGSGDMLCTWTPDTPGSLQEQYDQPLEVESVGVSGARAENQAANAAYAVQAAWNGAISANRSVLVAASWAALAPSSNGEATKLLLLQFPSAQNPAGTDIPGGTTIFDASVGGGHPVENDGTTILANANEGFPSELNFTGSNALLLEASDDWVFDGDFTIDARIARGGVYSTQQHVLAQASDTEIGMLFGFHSSNSFRFDGGGGDILTTTTFTDDTERHFAVVRQGTTVKIYVDGVEDASDTLSGSTPNINNGVLAVGRLGSRAAEYFTGTVRELRISKGIARWTSNFTPPTALYTPSPALTGNDTDTVLLLHCDGPAGGATFQDKGFGNLGAGHGITNSNVTIATSPALPYGPLNQGAAFATTSYLEVNSSAQQKIDFNFGTDPVTVEMWYRRLGVNIANEFFDLGAAEPNNLLIMRMADNLDNKIYVRFQHGAGGNWLIGATSIPTSDLDWHHVAFCQDGDSARIYLDGKIDARSTSTRSFGAPQAAGPRIGARFGTGAPHNGGLDEIRVLKGAAEYADGNVGDQIFTPSRLPYGPDAR